MAEYIEREAFRKALEVAPDEWVKGRTVMAILDSIPAAAVQPIKETPSGDSEQDVAPVVHGEWEPYGMNPNGVVGNWRCSVCNGTSLKDSNYCPNCGAKMDGERKETNESNT